MLDIIFIILVLLFVKHWYIDFVNQTADEVQWKGTYLKWAGIKHSLKHGVGTVLVLCICGIGSVDAVMLGVLDFVVHYHIDWTKININRKNNYTPQDKQFWTWLGADQLAHSLTYLFIVWCLF
jgi:hypothetical protein